VEKLGDTIRDPESRIIPEKAKSLFGSGGLDMRKGVERRIVL